MQGLKFVSAVLVAMALGACGGGGGEETNAALPEAHQIEGTVQGLGGGAVVLQLLADDTLQRTTVSADGRFAFPQAVTGEYFVSVHTPPVGLDCTVFNSAGLAEDHAAVDVACAEARFLVGGTITSDPDIGDTLVELTNTINGETVTLASSGEFNFKQPLATGGSYNIVVSQQSADLTCVVSDGSGIASDDVANVRVICIANALAPSSAAAPGAPVADSGLRYPLGFPANLKLAYVNNSFILSWESIDYRHTYRLFEDVDGLGPQASTQIGGTLTTATYRHVVPNVLVTHLKARYAVQACDTVGCSVASSQVGIPDLTQMPNYREELEKAIVAVEDVIRSLDAQISESENLHRALANEYEAGRYRDSRLTDRIEALREQRRPLLEQRYQAFYVTLPDLVDRRWNVAPSPTCGGPAYRLCGRR